MLMLILSNANAKVSSNQLTTCLRWLTGGEGGEGEGGEGGEGEGDQM